MHLHVRFYLLYQYLCQQYAGARNELDLKVTDCYNVSLAVINECGMSDYSAITSFFPPCMFLCESVRVKLINSVSCTCHHTGVRVCISCHGDVRVLL